MEYFEQLARNIERLDPDEIRQIINLCKFHLASRGIDPERRLKLEKAVLPEPKPLAEVLQFRGDEDEFLKERIKEYMGINQPSPTPKTYTFQFKGGGKARFGKPYVAKLICNHYLKERFKREYLPIPIQKITFGETKEIISYQAEGKFTICDKEIVVIYYGAWEYKDRKREYKTCSNGELIPVNKDKLYSYFKGDLQWKDLF